MKAGAEPCANSLAHTPAWEEKQKQQWSQCAMRVIFPEPIALEHMCVYEKRDIQ